MRLRNPAVPDGSRLLLRNRPPRIALHRATSRMVARKRMARNEARSRETLPLGSLSRSRSLKAAGGSISLPPRVNRSLNLKCSHKFNPKVPAAVSRSKVNRSVDMFHRKRCHEGLPPIHTIVPLLI